MEIFEEEKFSSFALDDKHIKDIKFVGKITSETTFYLYLYYFDSVDISEAEFIEEDKNEKIFRMYTPDGTPIYSKEEHLIHYDYLEIFAEEVFARKVIVPPTLKRRHMNRFKKNRSIEQIIVPEDCQLFSMKDGHVYNKKGTTLVYKNKKRLRKR